MTTRRIATLDDDGQVPSDQLGNAGAGEHPDLATHDGLGLATDAELTTHAATTHGTTAHSISGVLHTGTLDHASLGSVTANQHHNESHKTRHESGGADELTTLPSAGQKNALAGTSGTPGTGNEYVTTQDARNTNTRTPTSHAASHNGGADAVTPVGIGAAPTSHSHLDADLPAGLARDSEVAAGYQPLDSDLTAIAALTTTAFGRGLLTLADAAALAAAHTHAGAVTLTVVEKDLGSAPVNGGTFDITSSGLTTGKAVLIQQAAGPYTGKGDREDEAEMDLVTATGYVVNATTIRCYWQAHQGPVVGNVKFQYLVSA